MGTTNNTTGSNSSSLQFNPASQNIYNSLTQGGSSVLSGYMNSPFSNPTYNLGAAQGQKGAQAAGTNNMSALSQSMLTNGLTGQAGAGFQAAQKGQIGRANQAMSSQSNVNNVLAAMQRQMSAAGTGLSFTPQLTGQSGNFSQQQSQSGLGTWLPQLLGAGLSAGMAGMTGGASLAGNVTSGFGAGPSNFSSTLSPSTFGSIMGGMPGMAGMGSGGMGSMMPGSGPAPNPYFGLMSPSQQ